MPAPDPKPHPFTGSAFFSVAFRPFFLGAATWAVCTIGLWIFSLGGAPNVPAGFSATDWHRHEMVFGFTGAALAGFILTAMPNWTGRPAVQGRPLVVLVQLWLLGRLAISTSAINGVQWLNLLDIPFLILLVFFIWRDIAVTKNKRNYPVVYLFLAFALANLLAHAENFDVVPLDGHGWRLGIGAILILLAFIGGRIIPNFTRNWLKQTQPENTHLPKPPSPLDTYILWGNVLALLVWVFLPYHQLSGVLLIIAGLAHLLRLSRWRGLHTVRASIVFVLHIGYAWIGIGTIILGISILWAGLESSAALHTLTIGGIGTMIAAVMSRASLGHSGKQIKAGLGLSLIYVALSLATLFRLGADIWSTHYLVFINLSGVLWVGAFGLFAYLFTPLYFKPRL